MLYLATRLLQKFGRLSLIDALHSNKVFGIVLIVIAVCVLYFLCWLWWYKIQMRSWKLDYGSAVSHRERESLRAERRVMRLYAIPFFVLVPVETSTAWERKHRKHKQGSDSSRTHHHGDSYGHHHSNHHSNQ